MKTVDFSEIIAASDLKQMDLMKIYVSIEGQGHFLTLAQGRVHTKKSNRIFSETTVLI